MSTSRYFWEVPDNFFAGTLKLKVLHLARLKLYSVPNSIRLLELCLQLSSYNKIFPYEEDETHVGIETPNWTWYGVEEPDGVLNGQKLGATQRNGNRIQVVAAKEGDVTEDDEITFSKLRTLTLGDLPTLSFFYSENYTLVLPSHAPC
ncbi:hypothetical protein EZV62_007022 [Acer yangbiense]|uniref:Uncharacterized protein n=1 Tax=Acer yangbiense TaxID=1000413 RepID=A0A5C7I9B8_9ROSI|nr:hypothetical protein EZV62_007022 [Acer yangbiense]